VRIVNASVGGPNASDTLQNAVNYAWTKGTVIFGAAMNLERHFLRRADCGGRRRLVPRRKSFVDERRPGRS